MFGFFKKKNKPPPVAFIQLPEKKEDHWPKLESVPIEENLGIANHTEVDDVSPKKKKVKDEPVAEHKTQLIENEEIKDKPKKENEPMAGHHDRKKYLCIENYVCPVVHTAFEFETCCCGDPVEEAAQELYEFLIAKKAVHPLLIKKVKYSKSPNDACILIDVVWLLNIAGTDVPAPFSDLVTEIFEKYLELLDSL